MTCLRRVARQRSCCSISIAHGSSKKKYSCLVILSSCHLVILSSCHLVILSSCHLVILSSCHLVILSSCHLVILSSSCRFSVCRPGRSRGWRWRNRRGSRGGGCRSVLPARGRRSHGRSGAGYEPGRSGSRCR